MAVIDYIDDTKTTSPTYLQIQSALENILAIVECKVKSEKIENPKLLMPLFSYGVGGLKKEKLFLMIKSMFKKSKVDLEVIVYFDNKRDYYDFASKGIK